MTYAKALHRKESSKQMSALLIGDSMVKRMSNYIPALDIHFTPGAKVRELMPLITKDIFSGNPRVVILHAGTNNMSSSSSVYSCFDEVVKLCSAIQHVCPDADIYSNLWGYTSKVGHIRHFI